MATKLLTLEVTTPLGLALRTECEFVEAPSVQGEFGVFPGHLPVLAALRSGLLKYKSSGKVHVAALGPGFVEAEPGHVNVLSDRDCERHRSQRDRSGADQSLRRPRRLQRSVRRSGLRGASAQRRLGARQAALPGPRQGLTLNAGVRSEAFRSKRANDV